MYAIIDLETGGFSKEKNAICEIAIVFLDENKSKIGEYNTLIAPYKRADSDELVSYKPDAMAVNKITMEEINSGREAGEVGIDLFNLFIEHNTTIIVGHNAKRFDQPFLEYFLKRFAFGFTFDNCIDTLLIARDIFGKGGNKLNELCDRFNIKYVNGHRAKEDVEATLDVWNCLISEQENCKHTRYLSQLMLSLVSDYERDNNFEIKDIEIIRERFDSGNSAIIRVQINKQ